MSRRDEHFVIVGGGLAGAKAAATLREEGFDGDVIVLAKEDEPPYDRPPLSKAYLPKSGADAEQARTQAFLEDPGFYEVNRIDLRLGTEATEIDITEREVSVEGGELRYDKLLLATGSEVIRLDLPGSDLPGIYYLRTVSDADRLHEVLQAGARVVVVGAGWIGLEVAAAARAHDCQVTVVDVVDLPLARVLGPELGAVYAQLHRDNGVELRMRTGVSGFAPGMAGSVGAVALDDGEEIPADVVVVGIGVRPSTSLAQAAGLAVDNGVLVDEHLRTSDPDVFAAGDCVNLWSPFYQRRLRVEHWANALNGGPAAARAMLGGDVVYDRIPYFYSDQYDFGMEYSGWIDPGGYDEVVFRGDVEAREFIAFWVHRVQAGSVTVLAALNGNIWDVTGDLQALIRSRAVVDVARLRDPDVPLAELAPRA